ncbi:MAG: NAD-dependent epimerase/dehydratase family protein [Alphaproteobacteria bacterium]|nr:NAD-dependent epimerase/dehydratase family protein [Alphaproteobacteria bacterium]
MTNIFISGADGFIGSHIKSYLLDNYTLFTPSITELDLLNKQEVANYFDKNKIDFIIHCAAMGVRITPGATNDDVARPNIEMFNNLAEHTSDSCKMIILGSGAEYDKSTNITNVKEEDFGKSVPKDPYGYSKYVISKMITNSKNILNLRLFGVYGIGENPTRVTSCIINSIINKKNIELNQNVKFSFIYIDDLCKIVEYFIKNFPKYKFINVTQTDDITIKRLAEIANEVNNSNFSILFKQDGMNNEYTADNTLLKSIINEFNFTPYHDGIKNMLKERSNDFSKK